MRANLGLRLSATALAFLGLASLRGQYDTMLIPGLGPRLWAMAGYFTILTNALITLRMLATAYGWRISASTAANLLLSILMVGIIYHLLLTPALPLTGARWWADFGLHSAMPLAYLAWWLAMAPKSTAWRDLPLWLIWPLAYLGYALVRGSITGFWPYPFLNVTTLGLARAALNAALVAASFAALAAAIHLTAQRLQSRPS